MLRLIFIWIILNLNIFNFFKKVTNINCVCNETTTIIIVICYLLFCRSTSPKRKRKERSPTPKPVRIHVGRLTRNVTKDHIYEIFSVFGTIKMVDYPPDRLHPPAGRGFAYVEFQTPEMAENAMKHMDGGMYLLLFFKNSILSLNYLRFLNLNFLLIFFFFLMKQNNTYFAIFKY